MSNWNPYDASSDYSLSEFFALSPLLETPTAPPPSSDPLLRLQAREFPHLAFCGVNAAFLESIDPEISHYFCNPCGVRHFLPVVGRRLGEEVMKLKGFGCAECKYKACAEAIGRGWADGHVPRH